MKRLPLLFISVLGFGGFIKATPDSVITAKIENIIQTKIPKGTSVGICVYDLSSDKELFSLNSDVLSRPASVMKIVTTAAALSTLGTDFNFETTVRMSGIIDNDSVLHGSLYVVGGLDPLFTEQDMRKLVKGIREFGIKCVDGPVYADASLMDSLRWGPGWCWDDAPSSFQPYISPLMVHEGFVGIRVTPTSTGEPPKVDLYPKNSFMKVENNALTGVKSKGTLTISRDWMNGSNTILISGNSTSTQSKDLSVDGSAEFFFSLFQEYMSQEGITAGSYSMGGWTPASSEVVCSCSRSIQKVIKEALKESDNLCAEALFLHLGRPYSSRKLSFNNGATSVKNFLKRKVTADNTLFNIADGCGLSMYDYVPASLITETLAFIYKDKKLYDVIYAGLPVSGKDGTLKNRLGAKEFIGKVHAKTGTVTGACTLAGYAKGSDGRMFAFTIMNGGALQMSASRRFQDAVCEALCE